MRFSRFFYLLWLASVFCFVLCVFASEFTKVIALEARPLKLLEFNPPTGDRVPTEGRTDLGRGDRRGCPKVDKLLTALVPKYYTGLTVAELPTFWVYLPYSPEVLNSATFRLWDEQQVKIDEIPPLQVIH